MYKDACLVILGFTWNDCLVISKHELKSLSSQLQLICQPDDVPIQPENVPFQADWFCITVETTAVMTVGDDESSADSFCCLIHAFC